MCCIKQMFLSGAPACLTPPPGSVCGWWGTEGCGGRSSCSQHRRKNDVGTRQFPAGPAGLPQSSVGGFPSAHVSRPQCEAWKPQRDKNGVTHAHARNVKSGALSRELATLTPTHCCALVSNCSPLLGVWKKPLNGTRILKWVRIVTRSPTLQGVGWEILA